MPLIAYRPKELVTVSAPIFSFTDVQFEGEVLCHGAILATPPVIEDIKRTLRERGNTNLRTLLSYLDLRWKYEAVTALLVTKTTVGGENAWVINKRSEKPASGHAYAQVGMHRVHLASNAGQDFTTKSLPAMRKGDMCVATYVVLCHMLKTEPMNNRAMMQCASVEAGVKFLPHEQLMFEYDLLTKLATLNE